MVGAGQQGKLYLAQFPVNEKVSMVGVHTSNETLKDEYFVENQINFFDNYNDLLQRCDALILTADAKQVFVLATQAIRQGKHILLVSPIHISMEESAELLKFSREGNVKCMIGGTERFNAAWLQVKSSIKNPMFIEGHRLAKFNHDEATNSVIEDLMFKDIDLVLHIVKSEIKRISATGMAVLSKKIDIANARLEFSNGCIANLTASRISLKDMNKLRVFQKNGYHSIDFLAGKTDFISVKEKASIEKFKDANLTLKEYQQKIIDIESTKNEQNRMIENEIEAFIQCILLNTNPSISLQDHYLSQETANHIQRKINYHDDK